MASGCGVIQPIFGALLVLALVFMTGLATGLYLGRSQ